MCDSMHHADTATQVWHGELQLNFRQFKEPGTYYLVMKKQVQPTIPNPYFLSLPIHVRSLGKFAWLLCASLL